MFKIYCGFNIFPEYLRSLIYHDKIILLEVNTDYENYKESKIFVYKINTNRKKCKIKLIN